MRGRRYSILDGLRQHLERIEGEARFAGRPYPEGIKPFPRVLRGQGFFPGGDGLWREDDPASLRQPSPVAPPVGGIMFLGNDFGTLASFQRRKLHENPPTWRNLRRRIAAAGLSGRMGFFTNAYLGLRSDRAALDTPINDAAYRALCAEFLGIQITHQAPRLIVTLGGRPVELLSDLFDATCPPSGFFRRCTFKGSAIAVLVARHPYSDLGCTPLHLEADAVSLARAWEDVGGKQASEAS